MSAGGRVLVVGAGMAGLARAGRSQSSSWNVMVVERVGGRPSKEVPWPC